MASYYYNQKHSMQIIPDDLSIYKFTRYKSGDKKGQVKSVKLNGINTWKDWHLIPTSRPLFNPPKVKSNYIELPGANGSIDATQVLSSYIYYQNREGTNEFYVANGFGDWATRFSDIMNYLHGKKVKVILDDDPGFYYRGRLAVNQWKSEKDFSKIAIDYVLEPYKYELLSTNDDWLWDPFNFYTGIIRKKSNYTDVLMNSVSLNQKFEMNFYPRAMPMVPIITIKPTFFAGESSPVTEPDPDPSSETPTDNDSVIIDDEPTDNESEILESSVSDTYDAETLENYKLAYECIEGYWGNGSTRVNKLTEAGYNYQVIQDIVNVCYEVDNGDWGYWTSWDDPNAELRSLLESAGYVYELIMAVIKGSYEGEYDPDGQYQPTPTPTPGPDDPTPEPVTHEITIMTATAKGKKGVKRTIKLPELGKSKTYRYPDLVISEEHPKLIFTLPEYGTNLVVSVYYRGGML